MEIWKDIIGYEGLYQVSNLGNIKSLNFKGFGYEKIMKQTLDFNGYLKISLNKEGVSKTHRPHKIVAINFLKHKICGMKLVVNHINFIRTDNRLENLEIITQRNNSTQSHIKSTSIYIGVCFNKKDNKWRSQILINGKKRYLGNYTNEYDAHLAYEKELKKL